MSFEPTTSDGHAGLTGLIADPGRALVAFDYDGTLAPIVADPTTATSHPDVVVALSELAPLVGTVAVITGRPAQVAVALGGFAHERGLEHLIVVGHYGLERWSAATGVFETAEPPKGLDAVRAALQGLLESMGVGDADIEDKGLSIAVHVRRLPSPEEAFAAIREPLERLAHEQGLTAEPGRFVVELRPPGMDKGIALRHLVDEVEARTIVFAGDDLGDLAAFAEVERLRRDGRAGLLICSGSAEVTALAERADLVLDGPAGVAAWMGALVGRLGAGSGSAGVVS
ncbi:MAG: trehalose-phosphatase [Actinomycetota bacterium]|nr:trehalose-phosphatase [Actinomycetota bacterium]